MDAKNTRIFKEAVNGFGFEEIPQNGNGIYCWGCLTVHKQPTKMYSHENHLKNPRFLCRNAVIFYFNPEDVK